MESFLRRFGCAVLLGLLAGVAHAQDTTRYISDELAIVLRESPGAEGAPRGVVTTGARVTLLDAAEQNGYVRVRTSDNREGWLLARHLKREPVARERLQRVEKELAAAQAEMKKMREDHQRLLQDFTRISGGEPVASKELIAESSSLREQLERKDREVAEFRKAFDAERARQETLMLGGALVAGGGVLALMLRWLWPRRRRSEF